MVQFMMGNGSMINHVIKEKLSIQIKINMKVFFYLIKTNYLGNFLNGKKHGNGIYHYSTGGKYKGEWLNDKKNGYGVI